MAGPSPIFVFDAYGTLFDVHSAAHEHAAILGGAAARMSEIWRAKQLEYTWIYAAKGVAPPPFRDVTRMSLDYALTDCGCDVRLAPQLFESYRRLQPFPEVRQALGRLKARGAKLAILSNADAAMLDELISGAGLEGVFDHLLSVSAAGTYKPSPRVYALAAKTFGCQPGTMTFVSSNRWDIAGATASGFKTVWINRRGLPEEYPDYPAGQTISSLAGLAFAEDK